MSEPIVRCEKCGWQGTLPRDLWCPSCQNDLAPWELRQVTEPPHPAQPCGRCHGSGRVGYVMADGRRGKYRCPECSGQTSERKAYVEDTMRNQKTVSLKEAAGEVKRLLQPPTPTQAVAVEVLVDEEQWC